jgi:hypothetical protein
MTKAVDSGDCWLRNAAVAFAEVQMRSSGTMRPERLRRADRSRLVKIELFVRTRKGSSRLLRASRNC